MSGNIRNLIAREIKNLELSQQIELVKGLKRVLRDVQGDKISESIDATCSCEEV